MIRGEGTTAGDAAFKAFKAGEHARRAAEETEEEKANRRMHENRKAARPAGVLSGHDENIFDDLNNKKAA